MSENVYTTPSPSVMRLKKIFNALTGGFFQKLDGPGMERIGAELVDITDTSIIEGYWSEDCIGYVLEIFDKQVIVRKGIVQLEAEIIEHDGKLCLSYGDLISTPNNQIYGYISCFKLQDDDTILLKVYLQNQGRTDEHLLRRVDYPYNFERLDSLLEEVSGTYVSDLGDEVIIEKSRTEREKNGLTRHDCGYTMTTNSSQGKKSREDFFLGRKKHNDDITIVNTSDFNAGLIVRKNAGGEYELVSYIIEMGEEEYKTLEEIYVKR